MRAAWCRFDRIRCRSDQRLSERCKPRRSRHLTNGHLVPIAAFGAVNLQGGGLQRVVSGRGERVGGPSCERPSPRCASGSKATASAKTSSQPESVSRRPTRQKKTRRRWRPPTTTARRATSPCRRCPPVSRRKSTRADFDRPLAAGSAAVGRAPASTFDDKVLTFQ
jgi:hypothetical protein